MKIMSWLQSHFIPGPPKDIPRLPDINPLRDAVIQHRGIAARGTATACGASVTGPEGIQDAPLYRELGPHGQVIDDFLHQMVNQP